MNWKTRVGSVIVCTLFAAMALAQGAPTGGGTPPATSPSTQAQGSQIPAGTVIVGELSKSLDAKKLKVGAPVEVKTTMDLLSHGQVVIPRNTKIIGHVTQVKAHSKESADSTVAVAFDRMAMKDGREVPIRAAIQAMAPPVQNFGGADNGQMGAAGGNAPGGVPQPAGGMGRNNSGGMPSGGGGGYPGGGAQDSGAAPEGNTRTLGPNSHGLVGMPKFSLNVSQDAASSVSSSTENVHLEGGTQLILKVL